MKAILSIALLLALNSSCKAQKINVDLIKIKHEVLKAFLNQNFSERDTIYLEKNSYQKKYSEKFSERYNSILNNYVILDSLCKESKKEIILKANCLKAFNLNKYVTLFSLSNLEYFKNTYDKNEGNFIIQMNKISDISPKVLYHSKNFYNDNGLNFQENPSLKISGIYFSSENKYALISYSIFPYSLRDGIKYGILKNEKNIWWRYLGSITLNTRKIDH